MIMPQDIREVSSIDFRVERMFDGDQDLTLLFDRSGIDIDIKGIGSVTITPQMLAWINANNERYSRMQSQVFAHDGADIVHMKDLPK